MIRCQKRATGFSRIRVSRPLMPLAGALAAACCATACAGGAASTASTAPTASIATATTTTASQTPGSVASAAADVHGAPGTVLADWLHQIAVGDYKAACADMSETGTPGPQAAAACAASKAVSTLTALHGNFSIDGIKAATPISVTSAHVTGAQATVSGTEVRVSGTTLSSLMIAHSTGVTPKSLAISFKLAKVDGGWYVTDLAMNV